MKIALHLISLLALLFVGAGITLTNIYPYRPNTVAGWGMLVLLSLPLVLLGEFLGEKILEASFVSKLPLLLRIIYAVLVLGGVSIVMIFAFPLLEQHLVKW